MGWSSRLTWNGFDRVVNACCFTDVALSVGAAAGAAADPTEWNNA